MRTIHTQKHASALQKNNSSAAFILDSSSQSEGLQRKADMANNAAQRAETPRPNNTGMPDNLKTGIESLSGFSMDDVRVHYNSSKPATVQALAYTQGTDIHVAPGQEKHLPHEAWHVAQQMAGRVSPTTNINGMPVNDNAGLEHEADVMGEKAVQCKEDVNRISIPKIISSNTGSVQRMPSQESIRELGYTFDDFYKLDDENLKPYAKINKEFSIVIPKKTQKPKLKALYKISEEIAKIGQKTQNSFLNDEILDASIPVNYYTEKKETEVSLQLSIRFMKNGWNGYPGGPGWMMELLKNDAVKGQAPTNSSYKISHLQDMDTMIQNPKQYPYTGLFASTHETSSDIIFNDTKKSSLKNDIKAIIKRNKKLSKETWKMLKTFVNKYNFTEILRRNLLPEKDAEDIKRRVSKFADAYAKLATEGARFKCVRENMGNIKEDSFFYIPIIFGKTTIGYIGVEYENLWKSWSAVFKKAYGIEDERISSEIKKCVHISINENGENYLIDKNDWAKPPEIIETTDPECIKLNTSSPLNFTQISSKRSRDTEEKKPAQTPATKKAHHHKKKQPRRQKSSRH